MNPTDWEMRYQSEDMPWEKGAPSPGLVDFLAEQRDLPPGTVCVPGCGTGHDVLAWANVGFGATGYDIAPSAIRLSRARSAAAGRKARFVEGNFLTDPSDFAFDWIFEHTFFCAITPRERELYVRAICRWLKPDGQFLAVHYMIPDTDGPPFGTTREELMDCFTPFFQLRSEWTPRSYPNRTNLERMMWWQRLPMSHAQATP